MPLWGHLLLHVLMTFFLFPSTPALVCEAPRLCVWGRAGSGDACWSPAVALAREARCLARPGHAPWEHTGPVNPSSTSTEPHVCCDGPKRWGWKEKRVLTVTGALGEKELLKKFTGHISHYWVAKTKLCNDPSLWLRIFIFNFSDSHLSKTLSPIGRVWICWK